MSHTNTCVSPTEPEHYLTQFAQRLSRLESLKPGYISFLLSGWNGGDYYIFCTSDYVKSYKGVCPTKPIIEVTGDARRIQSILEGKKDARKQFFAGGLRLRGNLRYFSDLALELGILTFPL